MKYIEPNMEVVLLDFYHVITESFDDEDDWMIDDGTSEGDNIHGQQ